MRTTRKSGGQPHFKNVVVRWTTRLSALITNPDIGLLFCDYGFVGRYNGLVFSYDLHNGLVFHYNGLLFRFNGL